MTSGFLSVDNSQKETPADTLDAATRNAKCHLKPHVHDERSYRLLLQPLPHHCHHPADGLRPRPSSRPKASLAAEDQEPRATEVTEVWCSMPYPSDPPKAKHDLVGPVPLPKSVADATTDNPLLGHPATLSTTESALELLQSRISGKQIASHKVARLSTIYTYANAPSRPEPLSRSLEIIGFADVSLSLVRKFTDEGPLQRPHMTHCTVGVKRADKPEVRAALRPHDLTNVDGLRSLAVSMREAHVAAIVAADKFGRFGVLRSMDDGYSSSDYALDLYVGDFEAVKRLLVGTGESPAPPPAEGAVPAETGDDVGGGLWQPPGGSDNGGGDGSATGGGAGELWQPPGGDDSGGGFGETSMDNDGFGASSSWAPNRSADVQPHAGQKRPRSDSQDKGGNEGGNFHADVGAAEADAFYSGLVRSLATRDQSRIFHMRAFNGWVKATQIAELNPRSSVASKKGKLPGLRVLDLACGKGGDLGKWTLHPRGIRNYVGIDVARGSLKDAAIRARKMSKQLGGRATFTCADLGFDVPGLPKGKTIQKLLSWSLESEPKGETAEPKFEAVIGGGLTPNDRFDVVSVQFAIHYMMSTRKRAVRFFQTVSNLLDVGGNLAFTTIDARVVVSHIMNLGMDLHFDDDEETASKGGTVEVGGGACRLKFSGETMRNIFKRSDQYKGREFMNDSVYGLQYTFTLREGDDHSSGVGEAVDLPEWLAPLPVLKTLAEEAGFELDYVKNFHEFYHDRKSSSKHPNAHNALYNMKALNTKGSISEDEWEISRMYMAVSFRKVRESRLGNILHELEGEGENGERDIDGEEAGESTGPENVRETHEDPVHSVPSAKNESAVLSNPLAKAKLPLALLKAKKAAGDSWGALSSEEKKQRTNDELIQMLN